MMFNQAHGVHQRISQRMEYSERLEGGASSILFLVEGTWEQILQSIDEICLILLSPSIKNDKTETVNSDLKHRS